MRANITKQPVALDWILTESNSPETLSKANRYASDQPA